MATGARIIRRRRNPGEVPFGEWVPTHAVKFNEDGTVDVMRESSTTNPGRRNGRRRRNVAAGFVDEEGIFHPIRSSFDYSRSRAGEPPVGRKKKKAKKKKPAKKAAAKKTARKKARRR